MGAVYEYKTRGTCSTKIHFDIRDGRVHGVSFDGGCDGNLKAISKLVEGMRAEELVKALRGNECDDRGTSCADQLAMAVEKQLAGTAAKQPAGTADKRPAG
ncbi:MAG: TIGR03905 family TSCPD domain-containing protein [Treponema sp.]|jgi:uncharacterized protein (TIGR03905 family)|nr:TIGR03905 family TSCPD domain-containing protein [Treponema sp.]